jgi:hypothetical protein
MQSLPIRLHYHVNPLEVVWIDTDAIMSVEPSKSGGTEVNLKNGFQYTIHESADDVGNAWKKAVLLLAGTTE